ncbi:M48 family metalloprotease [Kribbella sp. NBC_01505]|uniref:M48 family metalloprotease n=1 Tax=Kribbella sp. NBC_01505 TaxID=2903580 RepID=UPI003869BB56
MQSVEETTTCPDCGHRIRVDRRYVTWCEKCDWNVDPTPLLDPTPAWRLRLEQRLADSLYRELEQGAIHRPGWDAARIGAGLLSVLILLLPLTAFLTGIALLLFYRPLWFSAILALLALTVAFLFRPRLGRLSDDAVLLYADEAPVLFGVLDEIATAVGTRKAHAVAVTADANVGYGQVGWRFRPIIVLGIPLWAGLRPQERVAILAHEFGHGRHGDHLSSWLVSSAQHVLFGLRMTFTEGHVERHRRAWGVDDGTGATMAARVLNATVGTLVRGLSWVLTRLELRSGQRDEYLADRKSGEIAGSEAAAHALERSLLADSSYDAMVRALRFPTEVEPLEAVRSAVTGVPARELERRLRASRIRETRTDATHPPTSLRTKLIRTRPATSARVVMGIDQSTNIDRELAPASEQVLRDLKAELG